MASSKDNKRGTYGLVDQDEETGESTIIVHATPIDSNNEDDFRNNNNGNSAAIAAVPMIEITAPATLIEGYQLDAQVGDEIMQVTIPPGGVEKGQKFQVPLPQTTSNKKESADRAPVGHWKDDVFDCCRLGMFHSTVWNSCCIPSLAASQVIHRLGLNWLAQPTDSQNEKAQAFERHRLISIIYLICVFALGLPIIRHIYFVFSFVIIMNLRTYMRKKYAIPETGGCPSGTEDCCMSFFCMCCTVSQMMRHTANYDTYAASCCTENGLPPGVSAVTV